MNSQSSIKNFFNKKPSPQQQLEHLSKQQQQVYDLVVNKRENIFFTGSAGTGKSHLLMKIIVALKEIFGIEKIAVTATTGIAAVNINGSTLHSFSGIGLGTESTKEL